MPERLERRNNPSDLHEDEEYKNLCYAPAEMCKVPNSVGKSNAPHSDGKINAPHSDEIGCSNPETESIVFNQSNHMHKEIE